MRDDERPWRPSQEQLERARGGTVPDVIGPGLRILFCGINPGLYSAAVGHHFARPGNRFWGALQLGGITERVLSPFEERRLLEVGCGITNLVASATATAAELSRAELEPGAVGLAGKIARFAPSMVAFLGLSAYRTAFGVPDAGVGLQQRRIEAVGVWLLPNPSGLNAHYQLPELGELFAELAAAA